MRRNKKQVEEEVITQPETVSEVTAPETVSEVESEVASPEAQAENSITINDLYAATQIIDVATKRGAFNASEAAGVGATYVKIVDFLKVAAPQLFEKTGGANE
jgi:hypothetical protein